MYAYKKRGHYRAWSYESGPEGILRDVLDTLIRQGDENGPQSLQLWRIFGVILHKSYI